MIQATRFVEARRPRMAPTTPRIAAKTGPVRARRRRLASFAIRAVQPVRTIARRIGRALAEERIHRVAVEIESSRGRYAFAAKNGADLPALR
jgi:hypothetical protein